MTDQRTDTDLEIDELLIEEGPQEKRQTQASMSRTATKRPTPWKPAATTNPNKVDI